MARKLNIWILSAWMFFLTFCWFGSTARALGPDDVGEWDISISGTVTGLARVAFLSDGSLGGYLIVRPTRNLNPKALPATVTSGGTGIAGGWSPDPTGRTILGFFSGGTTAAPFDMSFTGKAKIGLSSSMSLKAKGNDGIWKMTGVPAGDDGQALDGTSWTAQVLKDTTKFVELFDLTSYICPDDPPPVIAAACVGLRFTSTNIYELYGSGPGYLTQGYVLVGAGGRIGLVLTEHLIDKTTDIPADKGIVRSVTGKLTGTQTSSMIGSDDDHNNVKMSAFSLP